ncbi:MAG: hypothetical protein ACQKBV_09400 [Puniceicoccales bacterium]
MSERISVVKLRDRLVAESLRDLWWLARNGVTYRSPMSLQAVEITIKKNPQGTYQVCHVRDDGELVDSWYEVDMPAARVVESRGNTTIFRASAPSALGSRNPMGIAPKGIPPVRTPVPSADADQSSLKLLEAKVDRMQETLDRLMTKMDMFLHAEEMLGQIREQQDFLRRAEDKMTQEAAALEDERAELDQLREDLERRKFTQSA